MLFPQKESLINIEFTRYYNLRENKTWKGQNVLMKSYYVQNKGTEKEICFFGGGTHEYAEKQNDKK